MKYTLYHLVNSRSQRILWLLEELGCDYQIIHAADSNTSNIPSSHLPLKFPTLVVHSDGPDLYLNESSAIAEYLCIQSNALRPAPHSNGQSNFLFWKNYADCSLMPNMVLKQIFGQIVQNTPIPFRLVSYCFKLAFDKAHLNNAINDQFQRIESHLASNIWMSGDTFTLADVLMWFPMYAWAVSIDNFELYPHTMEYLSRCEKRNKFQEAMELGQFNEEDFKQYWRKAW